MHALQEICLVGVINTLSAYPKAQQPTKVIPRDSLDTSSGAAALKMHPSASHPPECDANDTDPSIIPAQFVRRGVYRNSLVEAGGNDLKDTHPCVLRGRHRLRKSLGLEGDG